VKSSSAAGLQGIYTPTRRWLQSQALPFSTPSATPSAAPCAGFEQVAAVLMHGNLTLHNMANFQVEGLTRIADAMDIIIVKLTAIEEKLSSHDANNYERFLEKGSLNDLQRPRQHLLMVAGYPTDDQFYLLVGRRSNA